MNDNQNLVLVTGAGGFIGGSLVRELRARDCKENQGGGRQAD